MKGKVIALNRANGMAAIEIEKNEITIVSGLTEAEIMLGTAVSGQLRALGFTQLKNESVGRYFYCTIENFDCTENQIRSQLRI